MEKIWFLIAGVVVVVILMKVIPALLGADAQTLKTKITQGALVLDVRTVGEYQGGHYDGALNIPVQELQGRLGELPDKNRAIVVYCASGARSAHAVKILKAAGFADVTNAGGLGQMKAAGK